MKTLVFKYKCMRLLILLFGAFSLFLLPQTVSACMNSNIEEIFHILLPIVSAYFVLLLISLFLSIKGKNSLIVFVSKFALVLLVATGLLVSLYVGYSKVETKMKRQEIMRKYQICKETCAAKGLENCLCAIPAC